MRNSSFGVSSALDDCSQNASGLELGVQGGLGSRGDVTTHESSQQFPWIPPSHQGPQLPGGKAVQPKEELRWEGHGHQQLSDAAGATHHNRSTVPFVLVSVLSFFFFCFCCNSCYFLMFVFLFVNVVVLIILVFIVFVFRLIIVVNFVFRVFVFVILLVIIIFCSSCYLLLFILVLFLLFLCSLSSCSFFRFSATEAFGRLQACHTETSHQAARRLPGGFEWWLFPARSTSRATEHARWHWPQDCAQAQNWQDGEDQL